MIRQRTVLPARAPQQCTAPIAQNVTKNKGDCLNNVSLAMVYAPVQKFEDLYTPEEALCKGTLFKKLYLPFHAGFKL